MNNQTNHTFNSDENTQPAEPMTPGGGSRAIIIPPFIEIDPPEPEPISNKDFIKYGASFKESFGSHSALETNLQRGLLFFNQHLFTAEGNHLPASFSLAYSERFNNINAVHFHNIMFTGWKLNYQQFIHFTQGKCIYVDGAFKEHIFEKSTFDSDIYLDTSAQSGAILRPAIDGYEIFDGLHTTLLFQNNRLVQITQAKGESTVTTLINYHDDGRINQVVDGLGNQYFLNYLDDRIIITDVMLTEENLEELDNHTLVAMHHNGDGDLQKITYIGGKECIFTYDIFKRVSSIEDQSTHEKLHLGYDGDQLSSVSKYACNDNEEIALKNVFFYYYPNDNYTIVSKNIIPEGTLSTDLSQIRYRYDFDSANALVSVYEIDTEGNCIGTGTHLNYNNGIEKKTIHDKRYEIDLIGLLGGKEIPSIINPDTPYEICDETIQLPEPYINGLDLKFNWELYFDNDELTSNQGTIFVECFVNGHSVDARTLNFKDNFPVSHSFLIQDVIPLHIAQDDEHRKLLNIRIIVKHSFTQQQLKMRSAHVQYIPIAKKEVRIQFTPSNISSLPKYYITEERQEGDVHWFPIDDFKFETNIGSVTPTTFSVEDYQKTLISYFRNSNNFNVYYNDCKNVIYGANSLVIKKGNQELPFNQDLFAIVSSATVGQQKFTHILTDGVHLRVSSRHINPLADLGYTQYDQYLRIDEEWRPGMTVTNRQYDRYGNLVDTFVGGSTGLRQTSTLSGDGQRLISIPNYLSAFDPKTAYTYNEHDMLSSVKTPLGQITQYQYQDRNILTQIKSTVDSLDYTNDIAYTDKLITNLSHNYTEFEFSYDNRKNITEVKVQAATLVSKFTTYNTDGSYCTQQTYANGYIAKIYYDKYGRVIQLNDRTTNEQVLAKYIYSDFDVPEIISDPTSDALTISASSKLRVVIDNTTSTRTVYTYNEVSGFDKTENGSLKTVKSYDTSGRIKAYESIVNKLNHAGVNKIRYKSEIDNTIEEESAQVEYESPYLITTDYFRDDLKRPTEIKVRCDNHGHKYAYQYRPRESRTWVSDGFLPIIRPDSIDTGIASPSAVGGHWVTNTDGTTAHISEFTEYSIIDNNEVLVRTDAIQYDENGNITKYGNTTYQYDALNRLTRENNPGIDKTIVWCYDVGGNITSRTEYAYTTGTPSQQTAFFEYRYERAWKDQLSFFSGQQIDYDDAGNPATYKEASLTWTRGKLLASYKPSDNLPATTMEYDASGMRRKKVAPTNGGSTTLSYYLDNNLVQEEIFSNSNLYEPTARKTYLYNGQGLVGFAIDSEVYTYRKNLFGDIISIYQGATKVAEYAYDAWGNCTIKLDTNGIGTSNPFRYRGYYWDSDLQLYYIQGRYYDPQTGRFISSANTSALNPYVINGLNLYSYASNNPVNIEHNGSRAISTMSSAPVLQGTMYNDTQNYRLLPEGFLYDTLGLASNVFGILNGIDVAQYLIYNPSNTKSVGELLKHYSPYNKISDGLGYTAAVLDGINVMYETQDFMQGVFTGLYDAGSIYLSGEIGALIGGAIGGIPGVIIGTIASIIIEALLQCVKENVVSLVDDAWDAFWEWVFGSQKRLANA